MLNLPISRNQALELLKKYNSSEQDFVHYLESEAVMKELAMHFKLSEDEINYWAMLGLLHDVDWGLTKENVETHLTKMPEILKKAGFDDEFISIISSHGYGYEELPHLTEKKREEKIEHALAASETITGLIHAYALMRGKKISDMEAKGLSKKYKDKAFAAKVDREIIKEIEKIDLNLEKFFEIAIRGIQKIKIEVGLE
jgi:predicted hydrolase (HD superfamily)